MAYEAVHWTLGEIPMRKLLQRIRRGSRRNRHLMSLTVDDIRAVLRAEDINK